MAAKRTLKQIDEELANLREKQGGDMYAHCAKQGDWYYRAYATGIDSSIRKLEEERRGKTCLV